MDIEKLKSNIQKMGWVCPTCRDVPCGKNFKIIIIETSGATPMVNWVNGNRTIRIAHGMEGVHNVKDLMVKQLVYQGCFNCFGKLLDSNTLLTALFKALWNELSLNHKKMPNQENFSCITIEV